jgi:hypothetical protein
MPTLAQLVNASSTQAASSNAAVQIEPLGGPLSVDALMDRFPEALYQQGRDTHLYRFISALCGDAGAALLQKPLYALRLRNEAELIDFSNLDAFYTAHFRFRRLADEIYSVDPSTDSLTVDEWDDVQAKDQSYRSRMLDFFAATRLGNSPAGMTYAARSATGIDTDVIEHYRYIFDQFSDDPLGVLPAGVTLSTSEFVVAPRAIDTNGVGGSNTFTATRKFKATFTGPTLATGSKPVPAPAGGNKITVVYSYDTGSFYRLLPSYEHNMINILDRLGPVGALTTISEDQARFAPLTVSGVTGSSERIKVTRYVNGLPDVNWPEINKTGNFFIQAGVENPSGSRIGGSRDLPVIFHTIESIHAYTNDALADPNYNTGSFYGLGGGIASFFQYQSEAIGSFLSILISIYPFLASAPTSEVFDSSQALAIHNTPLILEGAA